MALDFIIYDDQKQIMGQAALGEVSHWSIVERARELGLSSVTRFRDYYEDTRFEAVELPRLIEELRLLAATFKEEPQVQMCLGNLIRLAERSIEVGRPVTVFAD